MNSNLTRSRWAAIGAAVAVTLGAGGIGLVNATSPAGASTLVSITPCRLVDTRPAPETVGPKSSPLGPAEILTVTAHGDNGDCTGIPATATGLSLNVTALGATAPTFLTIWATGDPQPEASSLNPVPGAPPTPNAVVAGLSAGGQFDIYNLQGSVNAIVDVNGYYTDHNHDDRYYQKSEVDTALGGKANVDDVYTKSEVDAMTTVASDVRDTLLPLTTANQTVLSADISTPGAAFLLVTAAVEVDFDGGDNDNINCNINVDGVDGLRQSAGLADPVFDESGVLTLAQVFPVTAGAHLVIVECSEGGGSNTTIESAALSVLATI